MFDVNVALGRVANSRLGFDTPRALLREMDRLGIAGALAHHALAAEGDVVLGNSLLMEALADEPRLYPCWVMAPSALADLPEPEAWAAEAAASGVRAVRMMPRHSLYTMADWCVGALFSALEAAGLPVFLDFGAHHWSEQFIPWDRIGDVCAQHPRLRMVVVGATPGETRDALALLARRPNLYLEYHAFNVPGIPGSLAARSLTERLLFGTGLPARAGECVVEQTRRSGLAPKALAAVSGGNARALLNIPGQERHAGTARAKRAAKTVIDIHGHCGAWERTITPVRSTEAILDEMDRCGIDTMIVSSFAALHGETRLGNEQTSETVREGRGRIYGYAVANPKYPEEIDAELRRCFDDTEGFVGLKLHCSLHAAGLDDAGYKRALAFAEERALPVLVHGSGQEDWEAIAQRYPRASFIMGHGCAWDGMDPTGREHYEEIHRIENLYVDVAGSAAHRGALRALVDLVGVDKVLYGSDFPMFDLGFALGRVAGSELDCAEQSAVCSGNARRLFESLATDNI